MSSSALITGGSVHAAVHKPALNSKNRPLKPFCAKPEASIFNSSKSGYHDK